MSLPIDLSTPQQLKDATHWYSYGDTKHLLQLRAKELKIENTEELFLSLSITSDEIKAALNAAKKAAENGKIALITISSASQDHWTGAVVKKSADGSIKLHYNNSTGTPLATTLNSKDPQLYNFLETTFGKGNIDDRQTKQQNNANDCGPYTIENLLAMANDKPLPASNSAAMVRQKHAQLVEQGIQTNTAKIVDRITEVYELNKIYDKDSLQKIQEHLTDKIARNGPLNPTFAAELKDIFIERQALLTALGNVTTHEEAAIAARYLTPEKQGDKPTKITKGSKASAIMDAALHNPDLRKQEKKYGQKFSRTSMGEEGIHALGFVPQSTYKQDVAQTKKDALVEVALNNHRLSQLLNKGLAVGKQEIDHLRESKTFFNSRVKSAIAENQSGLLDDSEQDNVTTKRRFEKYEQRRNQLLAHAAWSIGPKAGDQNHYIKILQKINERLASHNDIFDQAIYAEMKKILAEEETNLSTQQKAQLEKLDKAIASIDQGAITAEKKVYDERDTALQYRLLTLFLAATPFGLFTNLLGGVFNYPSLLENVVGTMFDPTTLGTQIDNTPVVGKLFKVTHIGEGIDWLMHNAPIISNAVEIKEGIFGSDIFRSGIGMTIAPLVSSSLLPCLIGAGALAYRASEEIDMHAKHKKVAHDRKVKLEGETTSFINDYTKQDKTYVAKIAKSHLEASINSSAIYHLAQYLSNGNPQTLNTIFGKEKFKDGDNAKSLPDLFQQQPALNDFALAKIILADENKSALTSCLNKFYAAHGSKDLQEFCQSESNPDAFKKATEKGCKIFREKILQQENINLKLGVTGSGEDAAKKIEELILNKEIARISSIQQNTAPSGKAKQPIEFKHLLNQHGIAPSII